MLNIVQNCCMNYCMNKNLYQQIHVTYKDNRNKQMVVAIFMFFHGSPTILSCLASQQY